MQVMLRVGNLLQIYGKSIPSAAKMGKPEQGSSTYLLSIPVLLLCYKTMCPRMESFSLTRGRLVRLTSSAVEYPSLHWPLLE